jgi:hypothetical protein
MLAPEGSRHPTLSAPAGQITRPGKRPRKCRRKSTCFQSQLSSRATVGYSTLTHSGSNMRQSSGSSKAIYLKHSFRLPKFYQTSNQTNPHVPYTKPSGQRASRLAWVPCVADLGLKITRLLSNLKSRMTPHSAPWDNVASRNFFETFSHFGIS